MVKVKLNLHSDIIYFIHPANDKAVKIKTVANSIYHFNCSTGYLSNPTTQFISCKLHGVRSHHPQKLHGVGSHLFMKGRPINKIEITIPIA